MTQSDNTCNDIVLRHAGGPDAVRAMIARHRIDGVRFGPGERLHPGRIAGLQWSPAYSVGNAFYAGAQRRSRRRAGAQAFERYIEDPIDGATPEGSSTGLARLQRGELLSPRLDRADCSRSCRRPGPARSG